MAVRISVDVHASIGQSQGVGAQVGGDTSGTPPVFARRQQYFGNKFNERSARCASINVSGAGLNAPIRYIVDEWKKCTGRESIGLINNMAGSALLEAANGGNGFWQVGRPGSLHTTALGDLQRLLQGINLSPRFTPGRVYIPRMQGEQDGDLINGTTITGALYQAALQEEHDAYQAGIAEVPGWSMTKFCIYLLGRRENDVNQAGWNEIRNAQIAFAAANPETVLIVWDKCTELGPLTVDADGRWVSGWSFTDGLHYTGAAFRAMGIGGARNLATQQGLLIN